MGIKRTASSRQIDLGMQNQWFLSILQHKMQKTKLPYFSLYFWADSFENLKCPATAHFLTENSEIFSGSLFLITTGLVNSPWWNSTKLQILDTLLYNLCLEVHHIQDFKYTTPYLMKYYKHFLENFFYNIRECWLLLTILES